MSPARLFDRVVEIAPEFAPVLAEHLRDNGELLPHFLMPDVLALVGAHLSERGESVDPKVIALLDLLESEVAGDNQDTQGLITVSFLENLEADSFFERLYPLLGPNLRAAHAPFAWHNEDSSKVGTRNAG